jgi:hypothetical protein
MPTKTPEHVAARWMSEAQRASQDKRDRINTAIRESIVRFRDWTGTDAAGWTVLYWHVYGNGIGADELARASLDDLYAIILRQRKHLMQLGAVFTASAQVETVPAADQLSPEQEDILCALLTKEAFSKDTRQTREKIVRAFAAHRTANDIGHHFTDLKTRGLGESCGGSKGGFWLTARGREVAEAIASSRG